MRDCGERIGEGCNIEDIEIFGTEPCLITVGNHVYFSGKNIRFLTHDGSAARMKLFGYTDKLYDIFGKVSIGDNCFIGINTIILKGVSIGRNCIVGAGSVVTKDIPDNCVVCGVPAKVISSTKDYFEKNCDYFHETCKLSRYEKRKYLESHFI